METPVTEPRSGAADWPLLRAFVGFEARLGERARGSGRLATAGYEFLRFGIKQAWACLFGGLLLILILASHLWYPQHAALARYDALVIASLALQLLLLAFRLETLEEAKVIFIFHLVGTTMEIFKTAVGSWQYPEASYLRIGHVPLFTGFMYGSVGGYLFRVWRLFDFQFTRHPPLPALAAVSVAIYGNFFADHWGADIRVVLMSVAAVLFARTTVYFKVWTEYRRMPLLLGFILVALFIWFGENLGTFSRIWLYPTQAQVWTPVPVSKLASWFLLMLISYTMVAIANARAAHHGWRLPELPLKRSSA